MKVLLSSGEDAAYVPLALSFGVTVDRDGIERVLARREALEPLGSPDLAIARMSLATNQENAEKAADYFSHHRDLILRHLNRPAVQSEAAKYLDPEQLALLQGAGARRSNEQTIIELEAQYQRKPSTVHLAQLASHLRAQGYSDRFFELARKLVATTKVAAEVEDLLHFLLRQERHDEIATILDDVADVVATSANLRGILAWTRYRQGRFKEASRLVEALRSERDVGSDRALFVNILIAAGRWPELSTVVEEEWAAREKRSAQELLGTSRDALAQRTDHRGRRGVLPRRPERGIPEDHARA